VRRNSSGERKNSPAKRRTVNYTKATRKISSQLPIRTKAMPLAPSCERLRLESGFRGERSRSRKVSRGLFKQRRLRRQFGSIPRIERRLSYVRKVQDLSGQSLKPDREASVRRHSQIKHPQMAFEICRIDSPSSQSLFQVSIRKTSGESDLGVPFSVVAESRLRVSTRHSPFYCRFQRWSDELSSFYLVFVWWSRRLGGHSHVAVM
jgi:hypothetical protein